MTDTCQVFARWSLGLAQTWRKQPEEIVEFWASSAAGNSSISTVTPNDVFEPDAETTRAIAAYRHGGVPLVVKPEGLEIPDRLPFLHDHVGDSLGELLVDHDGRGNFTAFGEIPGEAFDVVGGIWHCSDHLRFRKARLADYGYGLRLVEVTRAELIELSASRTPDDFSTSLMVGQPGEKFVGQSTVERFKRMELPDVLTFGTKVQEASSPTTPRQRFAHSQ